MCVGVLAACPLKRGSPGGEVWGEWKVAEGEGGKVCGIGKVYRSRRGCSSITGYTFPECDADSTQDKTT